MRLIRMEENKKRQIEEQCDENATGIGRISDRTV